MEKRNKDFLNSNCILRKRLEELMTGKCEKTELNRRNSELQSSIGILETENRRLSELNVLKKILKIFKYQLNF